MIFFTLTPQNCETRTNGDVIRPFLIQNLYGPSRERLQGGSIPERIELNINKLHSDEDAELKIFCETLTKITGKIITKENLLEIMKTREIIIQE